MITDAYVTQTVWAITVLAFGLWNLFLTGLVILAYTSDLDERWGKRPYPPRRRPQNQKRGD